MDTHPHDQITLLFEKPFPIANKPTGFYIGTLNCFTNHCLDIAHPTNLSFIIILNDAN